MLHALQHLMRTPPGALSTMLSPIVLPPSRRICVAHDMALCAIASFHEHYLIERIGPVFPQ